MEMVQPIPSALYVRGLSMRTHLTAVETGPANSIQQEPQTSAFRKLFLPDQTGWNELLAN